MKDNENSKRTCIKNHVRPGPLRRGGYWTKVCECRSCGIAAVWPILSISDPCWNCGGWNIKERSAKWVEESRGWKIWKTPTGHWEFAK